ncbi:hypothetical protein B0H21DRAFT_697200 [Amylocystis lapponica]|nr:hypothetical protein B0H21DRAFT_697200 [Amylocystis lapponica]
MATVTHYIYSHYDPKQREALEVATGQIPQTDEPDPWQTESSFGAQRRLAAPRFVPAIISYDEINDMMGLPPPDVPKLEVPSSDVSSWYKSLTRSVSAPAAEISTASAPPGASLPPPATPPERKKRKLRKSSDPWFIKTALRSESAPVRPTPAPTLADILSREPPPLPAERPFTPPVFLALGPSNKGFSMLMQSGWSEGEPLGADVVRRARRTDMTPRPSKREAPAEGQAAVKLEEREVEVPCDAEGEVREVRRVEIVDLTLSDSEDEDGRTGDDVDLERILTEAHSAATNAASHNPTALLTPLPTVLKSDRLGLGLKAKTVGPHKESKKRVTHNAAALAAHMHANEEMRRMKKLVGRGSRGFARIAKAEAESRQKLMASLKDS